MAADLSPRTAPPSPAPPAPPGGWTAGRIVALVAGTVLALMSFGLLAGGGFLAWADLTQSRNGYLIAGTESYATPGYALVSDPVELHDGWGWLGRIVGDVRIQVTPADPVKHAGHVFVAIGPAGDVSHYLAGTSYATVPAVGDTAVAEHAGSKVPGPPAQAVNWVARATGPGTQTLRWTTQSGTWMAVVMNADGSKGVAARVQLAVSSPVLPALAGMLLVYGVFVGVAAAVLIIVPVRRASRRG